MSCRTVLLALTPLLLFQAPGCKKPEVEVAEEGPPLPGLPTPQNSPGGGPGAPAATGGDPANDPSEKPPTPVLPLTQEDACKLLDAHMRYASIDPEGRECSNLRLQGDSVRLNRYFVPRRVAGEAPADPPVMDAYNACFWRKERGDGWEVGYIDQVPATCVDRELYCKAGVAGAVERLSFRACGSGKDALVLDGLGLQARLTGKWRGVKATGEPIRTLELTPDRTMKLAVDAAIVRGRYTLESTTQMLVKNENTLVDIGYALVGETLYAKSGGVVAASKDPESFYARLGPNSAVRRFRKACYHIHTPPRDIPDLIGCKLQKTDAETWIDITVSKTRNLTLIRVGDYWMDADTKRSKFERVPAKQN